MGRLGKITAATVVVVGGRDVAAVNEAGARLANEIRGAPLAVIDEADHMVPRRTPEELSHLILGSFATDPS